MWKWTDGDSLDFPAICQDSHGSRFTTPGNEQTRSCQEKKWTPGQGMWEMNSKLWALLYELSHLCEPWSLALSSAGATGWWHHTVCVLVTQACPTLCDPMDCTQPGSSVHGLLQARILEWVAVPSFGGSSRPRDQTCLFCLLHWQAGSLSLAPSGKLSSYYMTVIFFSGCATWHVGS